MKVQKVRLAIEISGPSILIPNNYDGYERSWLLRLETFTLTNSDEDPFRRSIITLDGAQI
jgi:hypothetical protein